MTVTAIRPGHRAAGRRGALARALLGSEQDPRWSRPAMWAVLAVAFVLYAWALSGNANEYYAAAILSGTKSWKAFFFGAIDAGSFITVDKPPLALWVMGLSARIFGYGTWSMLLPQAIAGVAAVGLVFSAVRRAFTTPAHPGGGRRGHVAALIAAVVMTLTPITVAINRDNNPDTVLVLLLVLSAWFCLEALRTGRMRSLLLAAFFVGLGFNAKMLQAYLVVPALALAYLACARTPWIRRVWHLVAAGVVLVVSSAWWMVITDLWPKDSRPYIGGSTDNTVWDLVIGYNGLGRIFGQGRGNGGGGGGGFGGESGAGRLFNEILAGQISWLLPFCVVTLAFAILLRVRRVTGDGGPSGAAWLVWGGWLAVHYVVFSFSSGTFHPYYTTAMAPAVAALAGTGVVVMWAAYRRSRAWAWVLPLAVAVTGGWSFVVLRRTPEWLPWLAWVVLGATLVAVAALVLARMRRQVRVRVAAVALAAVVVAGLAGPAAYAVTPLRSQTNGTNPTAGPSSGRMGFGGPGGMRGRMPTGGAEFPGGQSQPGNAERRAAFMGRGGPGGGVSDALTKYLVANQGGATWLVAVSSAQQASGLILSTGRPVIAMGGFTGSDPAMTVARLQALVSSGQLRYVLSGSGGGPGRGDTEVTTWVRQNCSAVDGQDGLYDCSE
ncbi:4-amino-4-deoxy-L-arabinose transferase and related glycosyltransferases of PMT family [[Actinomadura] parvosata subsp. kistnae]|uniref:Glycosyl transferase family 39 n=1 Tax=[Actinomadura] parvosata subsp. kistnae TaxID=1909395 RepID=A0A1U9ZRD8_9ACTN|nr:glycosyltransferase family 39 protein [Nonomuraea sp. ATCC 55076]AQZ60514.1 glycosyl transferase family 39 [Nonomuraea sp. ATCC 55076]SPL90930.1 4-amino-4-deoxy-L-arabinose transferase and related glycosyltransferases of PMT family [Actinomadura parvosata subsp. kistnae]